MSFRMQFAIRLLMLVACVHICQCRISTLSEASWDGKILLRGTTGFEAPFVYSESGPYTGFCVDVIKEISAQAGFNYSLRQANDGLIGSLQSMTGVYRELAHEAAEFAIGDISRNWLFDERKAQSAGVLFTSPIFISTLSVLIAKSLKEEISQNKTSECMSKLNRFSEQKNVSSGSVRSFRCTEHITFDDIFELPVLNRFVIKGGAVHEYFMRKEPNRLVDLILLEKSALFSQAVEKLRNEPYVLIDETKFTSYFVDTDEYCRFDLIDVNGQYYGDLSSVKIDEVLSAPALSRAKFRNEIAIGLSASLVEEHKRFHQRNWLADFNRAIERMHYSGKLQQLQNKHWNKNCRAYLVNKADPLAIPVIAFILVCFFACLWSTLGGKLL